MLACLYHTRRMAMTITSASKLIVSPGAALQASASGAPADTRYYSPFALCFGICGAWNPTLVGSVDVGACYSHFRLHILLDICDLRNGYFLGGYPTLDYWVLDGPGLKLVWMCIWKYKKQMGTLYSRVLDCLLNCHIVRHRSWFWRGEFCSAPITFAWILRRNEPGYVPDYVAGLFWVRARCVASQVVHLHSRNVVLGCVWELWVHMDCCHLKPRKWEARERSHQPRQSPRPTAGSTLPWPMVGCLMITLVLLRPCAHSVYFISI